MTTERPGSAGFSGRFLRSRCTPRTVGRARFPAHQHARHPDVSVRLSVNVNKVAALRNSRGGRHPSVLDAVSVCLNAGVPGITVHPRADRRHITPDDVHAIAAVLKDRPAVEFNIEGDPRPDLVDLVIEIRPAQCTLVPVIPGEVTSQAGWTEGPQTAIVSGAVTALKAQGIRVSLFVDPTPEAVRLAAS